MPTLNKYADASERTGYFIRANVGAKNPITLQVSDLAERLLIMLGYRSQHSIPSKLVWSMYDVGLLFTLNSMTSIDGIGDTESAEHLLDQLDLDSSLSADKEHEIVTELNEYEGPDAESVEELLEHFQGDRETSDPEISQIEGDLGLVRKWAQNPGQLNEVAEEINEFEAIAEASIQTFGRHPYLKAPPIWILDTGTIKYQLEHENYNQSIYIVDYRFHSRSDYKVIIEYSEDEREFGEVSGNGVLRDYTNEAGKKGTRIRMSGMLDWVIPAKSIRVTLDHSKTPTPEWAKEYADRPLEMIREPKNVDESNLVVGTIDRISNSGNPVVIVDDGNHYLTDQGSPGETYLIERMSDNRGRVLGQFKS